MSGVKRVNAEPAGRKPKREMPEKGWWSARVPQQMRRALSVRSRFPDVQFFLKGSMLRIQSASLTGFIHLPAIINTRACALKMLEADAEYDMPASKWVYRLKHGVIKDVLAPWLDQADLEALYDAMQGVAHAVNIPVHGTVVHECTALGKVCYCPDYRCMKHADYARLTDEDCNCMDDTRTARDAVAVLHDDGFLRIDSRSIPEFWASAYLPLRMMPRDNKGTLVLTTIGK